MSSRAFILCKPDLFLRGLLPEFLDYLHLQNFSILDFFCGKVTPNHFRLTYSQDFRWDVDDWQHNQKLFEFGPALGLLLHHPTHFSSIDALNQLKGSALPKERKNDSIRYLFGSKSRIFNLLHVPDGVEKAKSEAQHWFGFDKWDQPAIPIQKEEVMTAIAQSGYNEVRYLDPEYLFLKAKIRLMHSFIKKSTLTAALCNQLQSHQLFYFNWAEEVSKSALFNGIEGTLLIPWCEQEQERICSMENETDLPPSIGNALSLLRKLYVQPKFASNFFWVLDEWNVFLSDLERYLITSRLKYL